MSFVESSWTEVLMLVGLAAGIGVPLGVPPGQVDAVMRNVAPADCLFYTAWAATATADPASPNHTQRLLAEPEVQRARQQFVGLIFRSLHRLSRVRPLEFAALPEEVGQLGQLCMSHPGAVFITHARNSPQGLEIEGGAIVNFGQDATRVRGLLRQHQKLLFGEEVRPLPHGDETWQEVRGDNGPQITWGFHHEYFVLGIGDQAAEALVRRMNGQPPQWLVRAQDRLPIPHRAALVYINVPGLQHVLRSILGEAHSRQIADAIGMGNVRSITWCTGLDQTGFVSRSLTEIQGPPQGIFALGTRPLSLEELAPVPDDAITAAVARADAGKLADAAASALQAMDPQMYDGVRRAFDKFQDKTKTDLRQDLLAALGDTWYVYDRGPLPAETHRPVDGPTAIDGSDRPADRPWTANDYRLSQARLLGQTALRLLGERPFSGVVVLVPVRDQQKLLKVHSQWLQALQETAGQARLADLAIQLSIPRGDGEGIYRLRLGKDPARFSLAWCLTKQFLIISPAEENIRAQLARTADSPSLARIPQVAAQFRRQSGPVVVTYQNSPARCQRTYPKIRSLVMGAERLLERLGIHAAWPQLPQTQTIVRHLQPSMSVVRWTDAGLEGQTFQTRPGANLGIAGPIAMVAVLRGAQLTAEMARRDAATEKMRKIATALLNYERTHQYLPPAAITDAQGRKLLSWRVEILPMLDQEELYRQFRRDEPWDSEHNRRLIDRMPQAFRSPLSKASPGMTNYLAVVGKGTVFSAAHPIVSPQILDGPGRTILVVEVADAVAVPWTKPEDHLVAQERPMQGLLGLHRRGFLAALGDGEVRFVEDDTQPSVLAAMFTYRGGRRAEGPAAPK